MGSVSSFPLLPQDRNLNANLTLPPQGKHRLMIFREAIAVPIILGTVCAAVVWKRLPQAYVLAVACVTVIIYLAGKAFKKPAPKPSPIPVIPVLDTVPVTFPTPTPLSSDDFRQKLKFIRDFDAKNQLMNDHLEAVPLDRPSPHTTPEAVMAGLELFLFANYRNVCENENDTREALMHFHAIYTQQLGKERGDQICRDFLNPFLRKNLDAWKPRWQDYLSPATLPSPTAVGLLVTHFSSIREEAEQGNIAALTLLKDCARIQAEYYQHQRKERVIGNRPQGDYANFRSDPEHFGYYQLFLYYLNRKEVEQAFDCLDKAMILTVFLYHAVLKDKKPIDMKEEIYREMIANLFCEAKYQVILHAERTTKKFDVDFADYDMFQPIEKAEKGVRAWTFEDGVKTSDRG